MNGIKYLEKRFIRIREISYKITLNKIHYYYSPAVATTLLSDRFPPD